MTCFEELWIPLLCAATIGVLSGFRNPHCVSNICPLPEAATNPELSGEESLLFQGLPGLLLQKTVPFAPPSVAGGVKKYSALRQCHAVKQMF